MPNLLSLKLGPLSPAVLIANVGYTKDLDKCGNIVSGVVHSYME